MPYKVEMTAKEAKEWIRTHTPETVGKWLWILAACKALDRMAAEEEHGCNESRYKECEHRPKLGDPVRVNCFMWKVKDGSDNA